MKAGLRLMSHLNPATERYPHPTLHARVLTKTILLHGLPDTVLCRITELAKIGRSSLMVHYPPYYGDDRTIATLRLFAKDALPHVKKITASAT